VCNATCENTHSNHQSSDMTMLEIAPIIFYMNLILDSDYKSDIEIPRNIAYVIST